MTEQEALPAALRARPRAGGWKVELTRPDRRVMLFDVRLSEYREFFLVAVGEKSVAITSLELTPIAYLNQLQKAVTPWDIGSGVIKSVLFAIAIAVIACQQGLATEGGAEGVGRRTTSAVVSTLFALIVIDALFTVFFRVLGR